MRVIAKRRRSQGVTDYKARKSLLQSGIKRVIFRKTTRYIIGQILESFEAQDKVVVSYNSKELLNNSWPKEMEGSLKSLPASYLTGFLLGKEAMKAKINNGILDIGLNRNVPKSRIYAFANGLLDSGFEMPVNKKMLPEKERIEGKHMKGDIKSVIEKIVGKKSNADNTHPKDNANTKDGIKVTPSENRVQASGANHHKDETKTTEKTKNETKKGVK